MRIALIDHVVAGHHAPYARDIALALRAAGHEVLAVGPEAWGAALGDVATPLHVAPDAPPPADRYFERQALMSAFFARAFAAARAAGADVAHVLFLDGTVEALRRTMPEAGLGVCATMHWYPFLYLPANSPRDAVRALHSLRELRRLDRTGARLIVHAGVAQRRLARVGVHRVHVVDYPSAVAQTAVDPGVRAAARARLGVAPDERLLLCFGGTRHDKGVDLAVAALAGAPADVRLLVAGAEEDHGHASLLALAAAHGVAAGRLLLRLGHVDDADVAPLFSAADAVLLPYRPVFSGQSGPLVIAGALGVPVIAADVPVLADTVARQRLGRSFRAGSVAALARALREPWPAADAAAHLRFAAASDPRRFGANHLQIYRALAAQAGSVA